MLQAKYKNWKLLKDSVYNNQPTDITFNMFTEYFKSVNNPDDRFFQPDEDIEYCNQRFLNSELNVMFAELDEAFTSSELDKAISELSLSRSAGRDGVLNEFLIYGRDAFSVYLLQLFNKILDIGYFPDAWSEGYVVPVHKKCPLNNVNNFSRYYFT